MKRGRLRPGEPSWSETQVLMVGAQLAGLLAVSDMDLSGCLTAAQDKVLPRRLRFERVPPYYLALLYQEIQRGYAMRGAREVQEISRQTT